MLADKCYRVPARVIVILIQPLAFGIFKSVLRVPLVVLLLVLLLLVVFYSVMDGVNFENKQSQVTFSFSLSLNWR